MAVTMCIQSAKPSEQERIDMPLTSAGYIYENLSLHPLADKRGRVLQHRRVWFDANGDIPNGAVIHHINGNKTDNRLENLELCDRSSHMKEHYPNGFWSEAWNKGSAEYLRLNCALCGFEFTRIAKEVRKSQKKGRQIVCGKSCRSKVGATNRWSRARGQA